MFELNIFANITEKKVLFWWFSYIWWHKQPKQSLKYWNITRQKHKQYVSRIKLLRTKNDRLKYKLKNLAQLIIWKQKRKFLMNVLPHSKYCLKVLIEKILRIHKLYILSPSQLKKKKLLLGMGIHETIIVAIKNYKILTLKYNK